MTETKLDSAIHVLKPRTVSVSKRVDLFLLEQGLASKVCHGRTDQVQTKLANCNSIECKSCGAVEYLSRVECRCGHYLRGQLEDEYLERQQQLRADYQQLADLTEKRLKPLRYSVAASIFLMLIPLCQMIFWQESFSVKSTIWFAPALLIGGLSSGFEKYFERPLATCASYFENYTFDTYIAERCTPERGSNA